ncbi:DNA polymerase delta small subunit Cdc1 [Emydomyces testavorans]|uniref:DNA-directed DNA polymerase n=1 Tax=Emydomyces testavorans TaxID=2070801 RepID=A0AAF0DJP9_9EURO|nr:DNA polymerase delta small subunit Cdc1 [Emydomyces testavorans]
MTTEDPAEQLLCPPKDKEEYPPVYRLPSAYNPLSTFRLPPGETRHYQQQYADIYFLRLARLKPAVAELAAAEWEEFTIAGEHARRVDRVLDVRQGELCWVVGTVYMDLPLKPNILDDISREHWTAAPPPRKTYLDPSNQGGTQTMLEDESGRLRLTGTLLHSALLVTGAVVAVLGTENANGDFEVVDVKVPDLPPQPARWERDTTEPGTAKRKRDSTGPSDGAPRKKIALVSGLGITGTSGDTVALALLANYLLGYAEGDSKQEETGSIPTRSAQISRLIIAGNSLGSDVSASLEEQDENAAVKPNKKRQAKKYGYDASAYNASPITHLDNFLAEILPSIPITLMPGETDPANFALPQQEIHRAMFPRSRNYCSPPRAGLDGPSSEPGWLDTVTNPWQGDVEGWRLWGCSGQNVDDVLRYVSLDNDDNNNGNENGEDSNGDTRLRLMEAMLRWRCAVPTAPDTIWCYPFQDYDPFVLQACPHVFFVGNQPTFRTAVIEQSMSSSSMDMEGEYQPSRVRLVTVPRFSETGEMVLLDTETLEVEVVRFGTWESMNNGET